MMPISLLCTSEMCNGNRFYFDVKLDHCPKCNTAKADLPFYRYLLSFVDEAGRNKNEIVKGSFKAAQFRLREIENQIALDRYIPTYRYKNYTLDQLITWYCDLPEIKRLKSYGDRVGRLRSIMNYIGNEKRIKEMSQGFFESYSIHRSNNATLYNDMVLLSMVFNKAISNDIIKESPLKNIKVFKARPSKRSSYIELEEAMQLFAIANEPYRSWMILAYFTGMRRQEIVELSWSEVDLINKTITLSNRTKNKETRVIPINDRFILSIFYKRARGINTNVWNNTIKAPVFSHTMFKKVMRKLGYNHFRFHDFRRCAIINFKKKGVRDEVIRSIVGHSSEIITMIYDHATKTEINNFHY